MFSFFGWFQADAKPEVSIPQSIEPFFENYCFDCHDTDTAKADLDLEGLTRSIVDVADAQNWQDILDQLNSGEMPPKKKKQPGKEELAKVVGDLTESLQSAQTMLKDSGGQIALRRINRREYEATVKELLGIRIMAERLPDDASGRFDTIGQDQTLSSMDLENYFEQGQEVVRTAMHWALKPRAKTKVVRKDYANSGKMEKNIYEILKKVQEVHDTDKSYKGVGLTEYEWNRYNRGSEKYPRHANYVDRRNLAAYYVENLKYHPIGRMLPIRNLVNSMGIAFLPDARAYYRSRASAGVVDGVKIRRSIRMTIAHKGKGAENGKPVGSFFVNGSIKEPSIHEVVWYPEFEDDFRPTSSKSARKSLWFGEDQRGRPPNNQLYQHYRPIEPDVPDETILVRWLEVEGPFYDQKTPFEKMVDAYKDASTRLSPEKLDASAEAFLRMFAASAFRGQEVSDEFVSKLNTYYMAERKAGKNFLKAMVDPLAMILSSPRFLYLVNPSNDDKQNNRTLDGISLANRLSSFLWSGPPDQELLELARNGSLLKKSVLLEQTERLMSHARAENFHKGFISQWMHLDRLDGVGINTRFHLHFTDAYVHSAKREPVEFFKTLLKDNLPANNLIDSDFVTVNGVLAAKYGLHDQYSGNGFQKVSLSTDSPRGGLMTQAAFLAIGTMGNRTSPVIRGSLVKEILLNDPPPPPPPNVPELIASTAEPLPSVRDLVELHQQKAQCASCHARFDFIGLGLENFDAIGVWREKELVTHVEHFHQLKNPRAKRKLYPVDASGELPNGEKFKDVHGLKAALMKQERQVAASLFEGLLCYALGRDVSFTDRPIIEKALNDLEKEKYPVRDMVLKVVLSDLFSHT
ncbi:DUF1592 domain-containing protein [Opitutales bacterium]|nr:DUF1592 domain-containing protein [Opitutales bacterium]